MKEKILFVGNISEKEKKLIIETLSWLIDKLGPSLFPIPINKIIIEIKKEYDTPGALIKTKEKCNKIDGSIYYSPKIILRENVVKDTKWLKLVICHEFMCFANEIRDSFDKLYFKQKLWKFIWEQRSNSLLHTA